MLQVKLKNEKLLGFDLKKRIMTEERSCIFEPEQGHVRREEGDNRFLENPVDFLEIPDDHKDLMTETTKETKEHYAFESNNLCVVVSYKGDK